MYVQVVGAEPLAFLVWTGSGAFEVLARFTMGELLIGFLLTVVVGLQIWAWWSDQIADFRDRQGW